MAQAVLFFGGCVVANVFLARQAQQANHEFCPMNGHQAWCFPVAVRQTHT